MAGGGGALVHTAGILQGIRAQTHAPERRAKAREERGRPQAKEERPAPPALAFQTGASRIMRK